MAVACFAVPILCFATAALAIQQLLQSITAVINELDNDTLGDLFEAEKTLTKNPNGVTAHAASQYFESHVNEKHTSASSEFHSEILHSHDLVIGLSRSQFVAVIDMLRTDVADAQASLVGSISLFMSIISQGLAALAAFLIAINAISIVYGQRAVVIALYVGATIWTLLLGKLTASSRTYGVVVLADSVSVARDDHTASRYADGL